MASDSKQTVPDPTRTPTTPEDIPDRLRRYGGVRPSDMESIENFFVPRGGKIGDVGVEISRYCCPLIDPTRWLYLYELRAGECAWEMRGEFFDLSECRAAARARAEAIDTQWLYKAVYDRNKREAKRAAWQRGCERATMGEWDPRARQRKGK